MGYSQRIIAYYGWKEPSEDYIAWCNELDYALPDGVMLIGVDSTEIAFGVELFRSSDIRWDPLFGEESFTNEEAEVQLETWKTSLDGMALDFMKNLALAKPPRFHIFTDIS